MTIKIEQKKSLLKMLDLILKISDDNNIQIWLIGGSLLGAVRQNNMIENDDDIDLGVKESDYQKLKTALSSIEISNIKFSDFNTDANHPYSGFAKLSDGELDIDIFPFDNQAKKFPRLQWSFIRSIDVILGERRLKNKPHSSLPKTIAANLLRASTFYLSDNNLLKLRQFWLDRKPSNVLINFGSGYHYGKELIYPNEIESIETEKFENREVPILNGSIAVLQRQFGDDWKIPKTVENHQK